MNGSEKRLDKVQGSLHPKEAFLVWMAETHEHRSLMAYVASLKDAPDEAFLLYRLPDQVEQTVRRAFKDQKVKPSFVDAEVRNAVREVAFYFELHQQVNVRLMTEWRAMCLNLALAVS